MRFFSRGSRIGGGKSMESLSTTDEKGTSSALRQSDRDPDFGLSPITKTFYEGKHSRPPHYDWVNTPPKTLSKKIAKANDRVAVKIYKVKDHSEATVSGRTPLKIHMLELQSPILVAAIKGIMQDEGIYLESSETAKFKEPFKPLFFCHDKIVGMWKDEADGSVLKNHLRLLVQVLGEIFDSTFAKLRNLRRSGLINFSLAWTYFPRNCVVFSGMQDCTRVVRAVDMNYVNDKDGNRLEVDCEEIAFDGEKFDWRPITLRIPAFPGNLPVKALPLYPLSFHEDQDAVKGRLTERAKKILGYQGLQYCEYEGVGLLVAPCEVKKHNVSGRILIDHFGYHKHHEGLVRKEAKPAQMIGDYPQTTLELQQYNEDGTVKQKAVEEVAYTRRLSEEKQKENVKEMIKRTNDLIFMSPMLEGFSLKAKIWLKFYIDDIKPVIWNDDAYTHLVYNEEQKDLVLTFVKNHQRLKHGMDDVIMGKGQGLILLLSGPPGTGKTLTAEAVADKTCRPLYYLQAEDLGTDAAHLGPKIKKVFEMATEWNAVILLDEADVFMAERSPADIARNELVSIFLRELEYFQGIIFLTTNLYQTIDVAFRSRVNIHLLFNPLEMRARKVLWAKFLGRLPSGEEGGEISDGVMRELAKWELNGREIKNAVKTVRTWCVCKDFGMNLERLEAGIRVTAPQSKKVD